ncbi:MAG: LysR family transcriptional regulator [Rhodospirillales bacterium]
MNIKGLQALTQIMSNGTLTAAATAMNISESALSRQLAILESELDLKLFSRDKRQLVPTPEGEAFFHEAERILESIAQIPQIVREIKASPIHRMRVVAMPRIAPVIVAQSVVRLADEYPDTRITLDVHARRFLERRIISQQFDIGIGAMPSRHSAIVTEHLCDVPAVVVVAPDHRLAERKSVTVHDLAGEQIVSTYPNTLIYQKTEEIFERDNIPFIPTMNASLTHMSCVIAATGKAITICDALAPSALGRRVRMIPIEPRFSFEFGFLYDRGTPRTVKALRLAEIVREETAAYLAALPFR